jgi:hypothetical protein
MNEPVEKLAAGATSGSEPCSKRPKTGLSASKYSLEKGTREFFNALEPTLAVI